MGASQQFLLFFYVTKGGNFCNFLFASLDDSAHPKLGSTLEEKHLFVGGANFF